MAYKPGERPRRICKNAGDDRAHRNRPADQPGPRCATCHRAERRRALAAAREARLGKRFGITQVEYDQQCEAQGGLCYGCGQWTGYNGATRPLSVDHDHTTGLIRGLLCKHCNDLLGRVRDDPAYFERMRQYLLAPPAVQVLGARYVPRG